MTAAQDAEAAVDAILADIDAQHEREQAERLAEQHEAGRPYVVYRLFDWDLDLVYIGVTKDFERRISQHRALARDWIFDVDPEVIVTEAFADAESAADHEAMLIAERQPRFNVAGVGQYKHGRYDPDRSSR